MWRAKTVIIKALGIAIHELKNGFNRFQEHQRSLPRNAHVQSPCLWWRALASGMTLSPTGSEKMKFFFL